jgi:hypothetical protein
MGAVGYTEDVYLRVLCTVKLSVFELDILFQDVLDSFNFRRVLKPYKWSD